MATTAGLKDAETNIAANNKETPSFHMFENKTQHFYGRDDTIQALSEAIEERKDEADSFSRTIILTGFDGMGKSETVKAFVEKFQDSFDCIVWINAQTQQIFEASFRTLATKLNKCYNSFDGMRKIQKKLSKSYKKGLFILENAERLDTVDDQFGIEDFLYMDFLQNKSIFLATSRNGKDNWAGGQSKLKFITIDSLPKQDAIKMLKNYLLFPKNVKLPVSLENAISSLVDTLGGYPLGLSFIGSAVAGKTGSNSIAVTESKLKAYNQVLKVSLEGISGAKKFEAALEVIYNETMRRIKTLDKGEIAVELLSIMACLYPSNLDIELVVAIYSGTTCKSGDEKEDRNPNVTAGLKLLIENYLMEPEEPHGWKIHKLVQKCGRKAQTFQKAMNKICSFFELSEVNGHWLGHISTLIRSLTAGTSVDSKNYKLCLLLWRYYFQTQYNLEELLQKCKPCFKVGTSHEALMFHLLEICYSISVERVLPYINWEETEMRILGLPKNYTCQVWVIQAVLKFLATCLESEKPTPPSTRERINSFLINQCMDFPMEKLEPMFNYQVSPLETIYGFKSSRNVREDSLFVKKLFYAPREEFRSVLWFHVSQVQPYEGKNNNFVRNLCAICGMELFTASLKFTCSEEQTKFITYGGFRDLLGGLSDMLASNADSKIALNFEEFSSHFLDVLKFWLDRYANISDFAIMTLYLITVFERAMETNSIFQEETIQQMFKMFDNEIMKQLIFNNAELEIVYGTERALHQVQALARIMLRWQMNAKWVSALLLYAEHLQWKGDDKEQNKNQYYNAMFEIWGVEFFIPTLSFTKEHENITDWCKYVYQDYIDYLLRTWKTPGNLNKFVKSSDFINTFMDISRIRLGTIEFTWLGSVSLHFYLCFAVLCLFDTDKKIYDDFNTSLEPLFENVLKQLILTMQSYTCNVRDILTGNEIGGQLIEFELKIQNCQWKPKWATEFLNFINTPLEALKSH